MFLNSEDFLYVTISGAFLLASALQEGHKNIEVHVLKYIMVFKWMT